MADEQRMVSDIFTCISPLKSLSYWTPKLNSMENVFSFYMLVLFYVFFSTSELSDDSVSKLKSLVTARDYVSKLKSLVTARD